MNSREGSSIGSVATGHVLKGWIFNDTIPATRAAPQGGQAAIAAMQPSPNRDGVACAAADATSMAARTPFQQSQDDFAARRLIAVLVAGRWPALKWYRQSTYEISVAKFLNMSIFDAERRTEYQRLL